MLNIALDYDNTYSADPNFWIQFIQTSMDYGHNVFIVTYRDDRYDRNSDLEFLNAIIPVYYTRGCAKKWWMNQFAPEEHSKVHIWIEDRPESVFENSSFNREQLVEWRKDQKYDPAA